jgi:hypothetical protein
MDTKTTVISDMTDALDNISSVAEFENVINSALHQYEKRNRLNPVVSWQLKVVRHWEGSEISLEAQVALSPYEIEKKERREKLEKEKQDKIKRVKDAKDYKEYLKLKDRFQDK